VNLEVSIVVAEIKLRKVDRQSSGDVSSSKAHSNPSTELAIGATHRLFIATNSAIQQFRILWTMDGTNCW